ncbi:MAG TPA: large-conductance mechanosensitive channel protein MscL [Candidatus Deferrimicrobium sp.]|nr:large-conductance mechanosensitive channel protein MscL [Candidatus Deferrimicrobium sp.]
MLKEFREFIARGNVLDMAVGIIVGAAFGSIVNSLVSDVIMPPIGMLLGNVDFSNLYVVIKQGVPGGPYAALSNAHAAGAVTINYGAFINKIISFLIVSFAVFMLIRNVNRLYKKTAPAPADAPSTKDCPYCLMPIPLKATRCGHCTSEIATA